MVSKAEHDKRYYEKHKDLCLQRAAARRLRIKLEVFHAYCGEEIACFCGCADLRCLTIDHIDGGGKSHCRSLGGCGSTIYSEILKLGCPDDFQVLCMNCNWLKRYENDGYSFDNRGLKVLSAYSNGSPTCRNCNNQKAWCFVNRRR